MIKLRLVTPSKKDLTTMKIQNNNLRSLESLYLPIMWSLILSLLTKKYKLLTKNTRQKEESNEVPYNENIFSCIEYEWKK